MIFCFYNKGLFCLKTWEMCRLTNYSASYFETHIWILKCYVMRLADFGSLIDAHCAYYVFCSDSITVQLVWHSIIESSSSRLRQIKFRHDRFPLWHKDFYRTLRCVQVTFKRRFSPMIWNTNKALRKQEANFNPKMLQWNISFSWKKMIKIILTSL